MTKHNEILNHSQWSAMRIAVERGHVEAGAILARKGADCTEYEKEELGEKYTNFLLSIQKLKQGRGAIREWMEEEEFAKLQDWLGKSKERLEALFEAGEVPVVGWLQLATTINDNATRKRKLEAELADNARELQQVGEQIRILLEKQAKLETRKQQLQEQKKKVDEISGLAAESNSIAFLIKKEKAALEKLAKSMENPYFMARFDPEDVSTVFSQFQMDSLFPRFKKNDVDKNLAVTVTTTVEHLQKDLELHFSEAAELLWKLKLLKHGEKGVARHLEKCSICSSTKPGLLLQEYGLREADRKQMEEKIKEWKGYYFTTSARSLAGELDLANDIRSRFTTCCINIQNVHKWQHED